MYKKILIQILLSLTALSIIVYVIYFYILSQSGVVKNTEKIIQKKEVVKNKINSVTKSEPVNLIEKIEYSSIDRQGNAYKINAEKGEINFENQDLIYMTKVFATINMKNSKPITIKSDNAIYNKKNYDTNFKGNILIIHQAHEITGENLDLLFQNNTATIYDDVIYTNINNILTADRLEIDLITKNSKIFMNNKNEKVKILIKE
jgi:LPS export ABC transporter protein LptC